MDSTPGPWKAVRVFVENAPCKHLVTDGKWRGITIADCGDNEANARLIAAAPELLEACEKAWDYIVNELQLTNTGIASELERVMLRAKEGK